MDFFTVGINYQKTPIHLRERFAFSPNSAAQILDKLKCRCLIDEALYLGTCNRAELYAVTDRCEPADIQNELCSSAGLDPSMTQDLWYTKAGSDAIRHLFRVASSLDSMVVGEAQILGQIKDAYFSARDSGTTGPFIDRAMLHAIQVAKKVRAETGIGKGRVSVASVAVDLAVRHLNDIRDKTVLVVGAGEMGALVVKQLKKHGATKILVTNRTLKKAEMIAEHTGGDAIRWEDLSTGISQADIVVSSTGSKMPIIDEKTVGLRRRPLVLIDLGAPRDINPGVKNAPGVHLFNIDDLAAIACENSEKRVREAERAETLVAKETERFFSEISRPPHLTTIAMLNQKSKAIQEQETERTLAKLPELTEEQRRIIETGARSIVAKILHDPIRELKDSWCHEIERQILADSLCRLFHLDEE